MVGHRVPVALDRSGLPGPALAPASRRAALGAYAAGAAPSLALGIAGALVLPLGASTLPC